METGPSRLIGLIAEGFLSLQSARGIAALCFGESLCGT